MDETSPRRAPRSRLVNAIAFALVLGGGHALVHCGSSDTASTASPGDDASVGDASTTPDTSIASLGDSALGASDAPATETSDAPSETGTPVVAPSCANPPCLNVINNCPFALWVHAINNASVTLTPDDAKLETASVKQYDLPASWPAARVNAYWEDPTASASDPNAFDKVELTFTGGVMNYNITYVDYLALPSKMEAIGSACAKTATFDPSVTCGVPVARVLTGCPAGLADGKRCLSAGLFCSNGANQASTYCHALDGTIATCEAQNASTCGMASALGNSTPNVYSCSGYFDSQGAHTDGNKWCAALNRGMLAAPDSVDTTLFYETAPFNTYAKWVHDTCPGIYAFAYDDYPSGAGESGFRSCTADRLDVTFCPGG